MAVGKTQLVDSLVRETGLPQKKAHEVVTHLLEEIMEQVAAGESVVLPGFGTFQRSEYSARGGYNVQTGEKLTVPAGVTPKFKASMTFKNNVKAAHASAGE